MTRTDAVKALHYEYVSRVHAAIGAQEQLRATWCSGATRCCCFDFYFLPQHTVHQRVASTLHRPYALPLPRVPNVCHALMTGPGRPGPAGLDRRPKEPPGARDGRRTAAGAAPAGRGTGLVPGCRHMLRYNDANDSRGLADFRAFEQDRQSANGFVSPRYLTHCCADIYTTLLRACPWTPKPSYRT